MAVNFTTYLGLAKPTEDEQAINWTNVQKLAEDNNLIVAAKSNFPFQSYTPTIIGFTTNPSVGAGTLKGQYCEFQGWIFGGFVITFTDPGVSAGTGAGGYGIKLPTLADASFHTIGVLNDGPGFLSTIGEGYSNDVNNVATCGTIVYDLVRVGGIDYARTITETYTGKTVAWMGPGAPTVVATGDTLSGSFVYKRG